jgi:hypothetical protein
MKMSGALCLRGLVVGMFLVGIAGAGTAGPRQGVPDLSGSWTSFTPAGVNGGLNTFTQSGNRVTIRHPNGQSTAAYLSDASTLVVQPWNSTGKVNAEGTRIEIQGGSMNGWTFVKEPAPADPGDTIEGVYIDQLEPDTTWYIIKIAEGRYQGKIRESPPGTFVKYTLIGNYSNGEWRGKITSTTGTFDGWEAATFRLKFSDDRRAITGAYTFWDNWEKYHNQLEAKKR